METLESKRILLYNYLLNVKQFVGFDVALIWDRAYSMLQSPSHKDWRLVDRETEKLIFKYGTDRNKA